MSETDWTFQTGESEIEVTDENQYQGSQSLKAQGTSTSVITRNDTGQSEDFTGKLRAFLYLPTAGSVGLIANYDPSSNDGFAATISESDSAFRIHDGGLGSAPAQVTAWTNAPPLAQWFQVRFLVFGDASKMSATVEWRNSINDDWQELAGTLSVSSPANTSGLSGIVQNPDAGQDDGTVYVDNTAMGPP